MARMIGAFKIIGKLGDVSAYQRKDSGDTVFVRYSGGPTSAQIKNSPSFENFRERSREFGGCGKGGGVLRKGALPVSELRDYNIVSEFNKICNSLLALDTTSPPGERRISFSKARFLFEGFNFNKNRLLDTVLRNPIYCSVQRETCSASIDIPEVVPRINFFPPDNKAIYRFALSFSIIHDMGYTPWLGYQPLNDQFQDRPVNVFSDWHKVDHRHEAQQVNISIPNGIVNDTANLILAIGIEFRTSLEGEEGLCKKNGGVAKILAFR